MFTCAIFLFTCAIFLCDTQVDGQTVAPTATPSTSTPSVMPTLSPTPAPSTVAPTVPDCEAGWIEDKGVCYYISPSAMDWNTCYNFCSNYNMVYSSKTATMLCIESSTENTFIASLTNAIYWIGYVQQGSFGSWSWNIGPTASCYTSYTNWAPGEPSDFIGTDDCATVKAASVNWDDEACSDMYRCGCEMASNSALSTVKSSFMLGLVVTMVGALSCWV
jgi:hypothetical protein